ncbi:DUF1657 domain-containing protein [Sulfoacidibacillus thermotolerans]|uniref:DUF1657 domain-containing protein n=1 Tax=Sulfoacidibacillus thermotolerans TaxID=1765684 RepID=A0A2U3D5W3_SULT2|nr:DUF1657 domain-containing protein [Sulfoacidibacillus thermotolerans]PWI56664.1 hypothetical protein BM613_12610 [Sulfoacidibacillus thermotolerans]
MTTLNQLASAHATALSLYATLSQFALETLDPVTKNMYKELANSAQTIAAALDERKQQLTNREHQIAQQTIAAIEAHSYGQPAEFTDSVK